MARNQTVLEKEILENKKNIVINILEGLGFSNRNEGITFLKEIEGGQVLTANCYDSEIEFALYHSWENYSDYLDDCEGKNSHEKAKLKFKYNIEINLVKNNLEFFIKSITDNFLKITDSSYDISIWQYIIIEDEIVFIVERNHVYDGDSFKSKEIDHISSKRGVNVNKSTRDW